MTLPPVIRIFFGINLPEPVKEKLGHYISNLKKKSRSNTIRWTKPENLHITLQFLAEVHSEHLPHVISNVRAQIEGAIKQSQFDFGPLHLFPNPYRPRVIVLEIIPQDPLAELAQHIGKGIQLSQYEIDARPFRAHLTLGRIKQPQGLNLDFLNEVDTLEMDKIAVHEVVLFRSEPQQDGSKYTVLERIALGG